MSRPTCRERRYFLEALEGADDGDVLVVDNGGRLDESCVGDLVALEARVAVLFVPAASAEHVLTLAETIRDTERRQAELMRGGVFLRRQVHFDAYLDRRQKTPSCSFRDHLRSVGGAIEE